MTLGKKFQEGKLGSVQDMLLFLRTRRDLGGAGRPFGGGLLTAGSRGHVHRLAHGIGNYAETHWPEARYSAQHYWPELLTDTQSALKSLFTVQNVLNGHLSLPTPCSLSMQLHTLACVS